MATGTVTTIPQRVSAKPDLYRLSVEQYHRMIEAGLFADNNRVELLEGLLFEMPAMGSRHTTSVHVTAGRVGGVLTGNWCVRIQSPITLPTGEPEPDIAIVQGTFRDYVQRHPFASDAGLIIEVADSSLQYDRDWKLPTYAAAGVLECWIINLNNDTLEIYRDPDPGDGSQPAVYRSRQVLSSDETVSLMLDGQHIADIKVADLLP